MIAYRLGNARKVTGRNEIILETQRTYLLRRGSRANATACCPTCGAGFRMVTAYAASAITNVNCNTIYRWAETGEIHHSVTGDGSLLVCLNSLYEREDCDKTRYQTGEQLCVTLSES